jgi:hypothetical protein
MKYIATLRLGSLPLKVVSGMKAKKVRIKHKAKFKQSENSSHKNTDCAFVRINRQKRRRKNRKNIKQNAFR